MVVYWLLACGEAPTAMEVGTLGPTAETGRSTAVLTETGMIDTTDTASGTLVTFPPGDWTETHTETSPDMTPAWMDLVGCAVEHAPDTLSAVLVAAVDLPSTLRVDQEAVSVGYTEYSWSLYIDEDGDPGTGCSSMEGTDLLLQGKHSRDPVAPERDEPLLPALEFALLRFSSEAPSSCSFNYLDDPVIGAR